MALVLAPALSPQLKIPAKRNGSERNPTIVSCRCERRCAMQTLAAVAMAGSLFLSQSVAAAADTVTPYSKAQEPMEFGLLDGKIRQCPLDINPNCVSTSSKFGATSALPWVIPKRKDSISPVQEIEKAILATQKNPTIVKVEHLENGADYLQAEVDGLLGRDALEFLVKGDIVTYRSIAKKVVYIYPLTTPVSDFGTQQKRVKALEEELGWTPPSFQYPDDGDYSEE